MSMLLKEDNKITILIVGNKGAARYRVRQELFSLTPTIEEHYKSLSKQHHLLVETLPCKEK